MNFTPLKKIFKAQLVGLLFIFVLPQVTKAQTSRAIQISTENTKNNPFWENVLFGGSVGLTFSNQFTDVLIAPNALYEFNDYFAAGIGLQGNYLQQRQNFETFVYGASLIGIVNPFEFVQVSVELEQLRFNINYRDFDDENFWNTALFLGLGLRQDNFTVGIRYNLLHLNKNGYYSEPLIPFVRVTF
jgi:hypothetical protein